MPNLSVFRDDRCYPHPTSHLQGHPTLHFTTQPLKTSPYLPVDLFRQKHLEVSQNDPIKALNFDPRKPIDEYPNCKDCNLQLLNGFPNLKASIFYPNSDPKITIYPNPDPTVPESPKSEITPNIASIPRYLERNLDGDYPNLYPAVTNQNFNPFPPYFS